MRKLKCLIADDEPLAAHLLESYVKRIERLELVGVYNSASDALKALEDNTVDIAFLDIQMPQISGLDIARSIAYKPVAVVFVTAYRDYAFEGFQVRAFDYLLKPVSFSEFNSAVERIAERLDASAVPVISEPAESYISVRSDYRLVRINIADILYVEGLKDYVKIYVDGRDKPVLTLMSLKAIEQALPEREFIRIHRSFVVALRRIASFDRSEVRIANTSIPIGHTYRERFFERAE